jgi:hypothetical protein
VVPSRATPRNALTAYGFGSYFIEKMRTPKTLLATCSYLIPRLVFVLSERKLKITAGIARALLNVS